jgi:hypothetical protein
VDWCVTRNNIESVQVLSSNHEYPEGKEMTARETDSGGSDDQKTRQELSFDIYRSIVLGKYMLGWGMPEYRVRSFSTKQEFPIEIYYFPEFCNKGVIRFATIGMALARSPDNKGIDHEWFLALGSDLPKQMVDRVFEYMADLVANNIEVCKNRYPLRVLDASQLAPSEWTTKSVLIDEPRGEPDDMQMISVGTQEYNLQWIVPVTQQEAAYIHKNGIESFDQLVESAELSIIDTYRPSLV